MQTPKQLWILAGGNGAGKSTFYKLQLEPLGLPFINADILAKDLYPQAPEAHSYIAARLASEMREQLLLEGRSFCFETVFSHPSKIDFIAQAKALGYEIVMVFIHLSDAALNQARVAQRVSEGGHHVPENKVKERLPRVLQHIQTSLPLCDYVRILDNSSLNNPFAPIATIQNNHLIECSSPLQNWATTLLQNYL